MLAVFGGDSLSTLVEIAANDDACDLGSRVAVDVSEGSVYHVAVHGFSQSSGTFTLRWGRLARPANDDFAAAARLDGRSGRVEATTLAAGSEAGEPSVAAGSTVWYVWETPISGVAVVTACGGSSQTVVTAYVGDSLAALAPVGSNDGACGPAGRVRFTAVAGQTFRIAVGGRDERGEFVLTWVLAPPATNDALAAARSLRDPRGSLAGSNVGATLETGEPTNEEFRASASVWYRWRAPSSSTVAFATCTSSFDTVLAVYRRTSGRLVPVAANDDGCRRGLGSVAVVRARPGAVYLIAVDGLGGAMGTFELTWGRPPSWAAPCIVPMPAA